MAMGPVRLELLSNTDETGSAHQWPGGKGQFALVGTVSGATITLEQLGPDGSTWVSLGSAVALTAAGVGVFEAPAGQIRALVASGTPSGLYATVVGIP